ncbi:LemA family protein [Desulfobotulus sp. H1]|uniref:LemA family protein n=1 Tax=Desulfobotulus pelophilus TaxID=2823377 RepID=A0ABT3N676_9BACT|nr:LemA family protein [Desulfobotulus pelophilus]MCW7752656.1 LemA family protein [Desulfobotulus pelophilus]
MRHIKRFLKALLAAALGLACFATALACFNWGFLSMRDARQIDRLPPTPIAALAQGPYAVHGEVLAGNQVLTAPYSGEKAVFLRYRLEEEYRDSDNNIRTRTLDSGERRAPFLLKDTSGEVRINPSDQSSMQTSLSRTYRVKRGDRIYSEWIIRPGQSINILGAYDPETKWIHFDTRNWQIPAILSVGTLQAEGGKSLLQSGVLVSIASGLIAFGIALLLIALQIHRFWIYVLFMICGGMGFLWYTGLTNLKKDWSEAAILYQERYKATYPTPMPEQRSDLYAMRLLIERGAQKWPDRPLFNHVAERQFPLPYGLTETEIQQAKKLTDSIRPSSFQSPLMVSLLSAGGLVLGLMAFLAGILSIKQKRLMEHIPTASSSGLSYGLAELKGKILVGEELPCMQSRLKGKDCVAYHYKVEEKRKSGNKTKWVTIEEDIRRTPFWLEDEEGKIRVLPKDAIIEYSGRSKESKGGRIYTEWLLEPGLAIYTIGFAGLDPEKSDRLSLQKGTDRHNFFFISPRREEDILRSKGAKGFLATSFSLAAFLFAASVLWAGLGWFTPSALFQTALIIPLFLLLYTLILHFNDIIFLRNRCHKAWSDIHTILQRRFDLWPQLEKIAKTYLAHEKELLTALSSLRTEASLPPGETEKAEEIVQKERAVCNSFHARMESYPQLKAQSLVQEITHEIIRTENYLSLLRKGYADSVEIFNTRIQSFPDFFLAKMFRIKPIKTFSQQREKTLGEQDVLYKKT